MRVCPRPWFALFDPIARIEKPQDIGAQSMSCGILFYRGDLHRNLMEKQSAVLTLGNTPELHSISPQNAHHLITIYHTDEFYKDNQMRCKLMT